MGKIIGGILWLLIAAVTLYDAFRIEKYKKLYNIQTYQEIIAFMEGKCLDEIEQISEQAKRPYQKILLMLCSMAVSIIVTFIMLMLFKIF